MSTGDKSTIVRQIDDLRGHVSISDSATALRFARLLTSPETWFLWGQQEFAVEIVEAKDALLMPNFGPNKGFVLNSWQVPGTVDTRIGLESTEWRYDARTRKMMIIDYTKPARHTETTDTKTLPDYTMLGDGSMGVLTQRAYRQGAFSPAAATPIQGGFQITRWLFIENHDSTPSVESLEQVREFIGEDGEYRRTTIRTVSPPSPLYGTSFRFPLFVAELLWAKSKVAKQSWEDYWQAGADMDAYQRWILAGLYPGQNEAAANGIRLLHFVDHPKKIEPDEEAKAWIGKRVAFRGSSVPYRMEIGSGVFVEVEYEQSVANRQWPIILDSSIIGTVTTVDRRNRTVHIRANFRDWNLLGTG